MGITPTEMRAFADDCLQWSRSATNASQRDVMMGIARGWIAIASGIERRLDDGAVLVSDLRRKLD